MLSMLMFFNSIRKFLEGVYLTSHVIGLLEKVGDHVTLVEQLLLGELNLLGAK